MPLLRSKPLTYQAHKLRYEDFHLEQAALPDWFTELEAEGKISRSWQAGTIYVETAASVVPAKLGMWLLMAPNEELRLVTEAEVANEFELVG